MAFPKDTMFRNSKIVILVPSTELDKKISTREFNKRILNTQRFLTEKFGGTTTVDADGTFIMERGKLKGSLVREPIAEVESYISSKKLLGRKRKQLDDFLMGKKKKWKQESLSVIYQPPKKNEQLHFI